MEERSTVYRNETSILVVGCGGGGVNAINRMIYGGMSGVAFVAANTDRQSLQDTPADYLLHMGATLRGSGAGADPRIGEAAARESEKEIRTILQQADMVFITAGMGGGTGTGAAPVVAEISQELGILTVAVVTTPFLFEGKRRMDNAAEAIEKLRKTLDTVLVIPNQVLVTRCDPGMRMTRAFELADDTLFKGVAGVAELITTPGEINLDFNDIKRLLSRKGLVYWGIGYGQGEGGCLSAIDGALASPFMEDRSIEGAHTLIVNVCGGDDLGFFEANEALEYLESIASPEAEIKLGMSCHNGQRDLVKITLIAKGGQKVKRRQKVTEITDVLQLVTDERRGFHDLPREIIESRSTPSILRKFLLCN